MKFPKRRSLRLAVYAIALILTSPAQASVLFLIEEIGADVHVTGSGTFDFTGLPFQHTAPSFVAFSTSFVLPGAPSGPALVVGPTAQVDRYGFTSSTEDFGSALSTAASTSLGDTFGMDTSSTFAVPIGYSAGDPLSGSAIYENHSFADLGLVEGTYTQLFENGETVTMQVGAAVVPLPSALPLFASGLSAVGLIGWRRKRKKAALAAARTHDA